MKGERGARINLNYTGTFLVHPVMHHIFPSAVGLKCKLYLALHLKANILLQNYARMREQFGKEEWSYMPHTYILPGERDQLRRKMRKVKNSFWIIKPPNLFCGMGIKVINDFKEVPVKKGPLCVQRYLKKPLLIDGLKFDLRVYVLVTSVEPLRVFLYEEGLARKPVVTLIHRIFRNKVYLKSPSTKWIISKKLSALFWQNWVLTREFEFAIFFAACQNQWKSRQSCLIVTTELISICNLCTPDFCTL